MSKKNSITRSLLRGLLIAGTITIAAGSPYFVLRLLSQIMKKLGEPGTEDGRKKKSIDSVFYRLKKQGLIRIKYKGNQIYISLTEQGKKKAGKYQINDMQIKPTKWDGKWRVLIFDIKEKQKIKREALRGKLKEMNFFQLQKSVWVYPFDFKKEAEMLKEFFGLGVDEIKIISDCKIEDDQIIRSYFKL